MTAVETLAAVLGRPGWQRWAACRGVDPALFFIERGEPPGPARSVCRSCVVREQCLDFSLANGEKYGIWGGLTERERRTVRRQRKQGAA